jgi:energy-converting hydrogenase Eha subunit B
MSVHARDIEGSFELFLYRLMGAAVLDASMYEGIEADRRASGQAAATVLLASVAAGVGAAGPHGWQVSRIAGVAILALVAWVAWATLMFYIGTRLLPEPQTSTTLGELLRTTGFAAAPGLLQAFAAFPGMVAPVFVVTWLWVIAAMIVGVKHALDYQSTSRAIGVCVIAAALSAGLALAFGALFGPTVS